MPAQKYRQRPRVVEAMLWDGSHERAIEITQWIGYASFYDPNPVHIPGPGRGMTTLPSAIGIATLSGRKLYAPPGFYIVKDSLEGFYPCSAEQFEALYQLA